eukprot:scaffold9972_cov118-Isochrysis_galbana.AAC.10
MIRPISPSSASTSRTSWPLPMPPIDGLQDISPIVSSRWVTSTVRAPLRAAAAAASQPACPPPTTTTSTSLTTEAQIADRLTRPAVRRGGTPTQHRHR